MGHTDGGRNASAAAEASGEQLPPGEQQQPANCQRPSLPSSTRGCAKAETGPGGGREEPLLSPAKLVAQPEQASFGRWKSFEGLGRTEEACSKSSHWKICANWHRGLSPRSPDLAKEDRAEVEAKGVAW